MSKIAVIGGGIAGVTAANELARAGLDVVIIEKSGELGGNIKDYGCKAVDLCAKCNLCLVDDIFQQVRQASNIETLLNTNVNDLRGRPGNYTLGIESKGTFKDLADLSHIVLATGFVRWSQLETGTPEISSDTRIVWASELEEYLLHRRDHTLCGDPLGFTSKPKSVAFLYCNGSRSIQEKARHCSRVCCGYSYRMARIMKHFYPEVDVTVFFMDLQEGGYLEDAAFDRLMEKGIKWVNCKPVKVEESTGSLKIIYEDQKTGKIESYGADLLILAEGMHPNPDNDRFSNLLNLQMDAYGFLQTIDREEDTQIFLAGTVKGPGDIAHTVAGSKEVAYRILNLARCTGGRTNV